MDKLAEMIWFIMEHYNIDRFIGFGSGAGGNILCRFALSHPDKVEGLILINCTASKAGWTEWAYQKMNIYHLCRGRLTDGVEEYLLWHWFGTKTVDTNYDLVNAYSTYIKHINPYNLGHLIDSYVKRTDLDIVREVLPSKKKAARMIRCPVMLVTSDHSPHLNDTVAMNARLDPTNSTWIKYDCGGLVLEEQPGKLTESLRLFLQGMGYVPSLRKTQLAPRNFEFHYLPRGAASSSSSSKKVDSNPASVYVIGNATRV
ncbi:DgyrCDS6299 [Dimorphilus gyrociliatus]|uniref:DgyrCDS6299 n=1 Tax=Dimorphilus gyrociliatus TaxID=2664684 RepID=A0A7I8VP98_9ANNE|nr:DgyrCDS6299 [Dimorphilus gyrociliatus]